MLQRLSAFAILFGLCASFLAAVLVALVGTSLLQIELPDDRAPFSELDLALLTDSRFLGVALVAALVSAFVAGYSAASLAPGDELPNALALGALLLPMGFAGAGSSDTGLLPLWYSLPTFLLTVPACLLGARLRRGPSHPA
jgi:hypothetical protein